MNVVRQLSCALVLLLCVGCTGTRMVTPTADLASFLRHGERIVVYQRSGEADTLLFGKVTGTHLIGSHDRAPYAPMRIALEEISGIQVERVDGARTTLAVIAGAIFIPPILVLEALEDTCFRDC